MGMEFISIKMGRNIQVVGEMIYSMEWEYKIGQIIHPMKECILLEKNTEREPINGVMGVNTQEIGKIIR